MKPRRGIMLTAAAFAVAMNVGCSVYGPPEDEGEDVSLQNIEQSVENIEAQDSEEEKL